MNREPGFILPLLTLLLICVLAFGLHAIVMKDDTRGDPLGQTESDAMSSGTQTEAASA